MTTAYVYRVFDAEGVLLYIGHTVDPFSRMAVHRSSWHNPASALLSLRAARCVLASYPDKYAAQRAEAEAIRDEAPIGNMHFQRTETLATALGARQERIDTYLASLPADSPYGGNIAYEGDLPVADGAA